MKNITKVSKKMGLTVFLLILIFGTSSAKVFINEVSGNDKWFELYNDGTESVNLTGYTIAKFIAEGEVDDEPWVADQTKEGAAVVWALPSGTTIEAKGFQAWTQNAANSFTWGISAKRDVALKLINPDGDVVDFFEIRMSAGLNSDGGGKSVGRETDGAAKLIVFDIPTKGVSNGAPPTPPDPIFNVYVNEVSGNDKWFELYNAEDIAVDLLGYKIEKFVGLTDKDGIFDEDWKLDKTWTFSSDIDGGTEIAAKGFRVWTSGESGSFTWGISAKRDVAFKLYNAQGEILDFIEIRMSAGLNSEGNDKSVGRETDGSNKLVVFTTATKGASNNGFARTKTFNYDDNFTIYQNGNDLRLTNQIRTISIFNVAGEKILSQRVTEQAVNISQFPQGIYLLQLIDENNNTRTQKIIKK